MKLTLLRSPSEHQSSEAAGVVVRTIDEEHKARALQELRWNRRLKDDQCRSLERAGRLFECRVPSQYSVCEFPPPKKR